MDERAAKIRAIIRHALQAEHDGRAFDIQEAITANSDLMPELAEQLDSLTNIQRGRRLLATLPERYRLDQFLGSGGFGRVWKAWDSQRGMYVAIKFPKAENPAAIKRLREELQCAAKLMADEIVWVLDVNFKGDEDQAPLDFIVLRYIEGQTLRDWLSDANDRGLPRTRAELQSRIRMAIRVVSAMRYAHANEVIHRDIKLENILVDQEQRTYLNDFGLAQGGQVPNNDLVGTLAYMAPEQIGFLQKVERRNWSCASSLVEDGLRSQASFASDIYAFGIVLYELVAHSRPFTGSRTQLLHQVQFVQPTRPSQINHAIDADLDEIILRCLAKQPSQRYGSAAAIEAELNKWLCGDEVEARPRPLSEKCRRWIVRHPWRAMSGMAASLLVFLLYAAYLYQTYVNQVIGSQNVALEESNKATEMARQRSTQSLVQLHLDRVTKLVEANDPNLAIAHLIAAGNQADLSATPHYNRMLNIVLRYAPELNDCAWLPDSFSLQHNAKDDVVVAVAPESLGFRSAKSLQDIHRPALQLPAFKKNEHEIASGFLSPAANYVVLRCIAGGVHIYRQDQHRFLRLSDLTDSVNQVQISSGDQALAIGKSDGRVLLWSSLDRAEEEKPRVLEHSLPVTAMVFSPDGTRLAVGLGSSDQPGGSCTIYDVAEAKPLGTNNDPGDDVLQLAFSRSGKWLAFGAWNGNVSMLRGDNAGGTGGRGLRMSGIITGLEFSPSEHELASASADGSATVTDLFGPYAIIKQLRHENDIASMLYLPNDMLVTRGLDRKVKIWMRGIVATAFTNLSSSRELSAIASQNNDVLVLDASGMVKRWKLRGRNPSLRVHVIEAEFVKPISLNRMIVASGSRKVGQPSGGALFCIDSQTGKSLDMILRLSDEIASISVSADPAFVAVLTNDKKCRVWRIEDRFTEISQSEPIYANKLVGFDRNRLLFIDQMEQLVAWDLADNSLTTRSSNRVKYKELATAQHNTLFYVSASSEAELWDNDQPEPVARAKLPDSLNEDYPANAQVAISPDRKLVCFSAEEKAWLWKVGIGIQLLKSPHSKTIRAIAFSPDSQRLALASQDHTASLWTVDDCRIVSMLRCADEVNQVVFSNSSDLIATSDGSSASGRFGNARLWDADTGCLVAILPHSNDVYDSAFSADDDALWTASWDGFATKWPLPSTDFSRQDWQMLSHCLYGEAIGLEGVNRLEPSEVEKAWNQLKDKIVK